MSSLKTPAPPLYFSHPVNGLYCEKHAKQKEYMVNSPSPHPQPGPGRKHSWLHRR